MSFVRPLLKGYRATSSCRCTQIICARDNVSTGHWLILQRKCSLFGKDYSRCEIFFHSIHSEYTTGNARKALTVSLHPDHRLLAWSQKICDIRTSLVSWAARAKWKCHILSNEVRHPRKELLFWLIWRRKQDDDLYTHLFLLHVLCRLVHCCQKSSTPRSGRMTISPIFSPEYFQVKTWTHTITFSPE